MISVCMATHNGARFLPRQLETILEQLEDGDELVVSDDASTDATLDIVRACADPRIRLFGGNRFHSPVRNFEHALRQGRQRGSRHLRIVRTQLAAFDALLKEFHRALHELVQVTRGLAPHFLILTAEGAEIISNFRGLRSGLLNLEQ